MHWIFVGIMIEIGLAVAPYVIGLIIVAITKRQAQERHASVN